MAAALVAIAGPRLAALAVTCAGCAPRAGAPPPAAPVAVPPATLTKAELRPVLKAVVPALAACVGDGTAAGVVELALTITSDARGTSIVVDDVLVTGPLAAAPGSAGARPRRWRRRRRRASIARGTRRSATRSRSTRSRPTTATPRSSTPPRGPLRPGGGARRGPRPRPA